MNIESVASRAKVSISTVSRALRNDPRISESTRVRIQKMHQHDFSEPSHQYSTLVEGEWVSGTTTAPCKTST